MGLIESLRKPWSIMIPSWNKLDYLKACINSIRKYSELDHQIVVHINEGTDGSLDYVKDHGLNYSYTKDNSGVSKAMNLARKKCVNDILVYINDDMIVLPKWDTEIIAFAEKHNLDDIKTWLSATWIEPRPGTNCCISPMDFGQTLEEFRLDDLLHALETIRRVGKKNPVAGTTWPPTLLHRKVWDEIGGFSEEYWPGFGSDPDLAKKCYDIGVRNFIGVNTSIVYHFGSMTTRKYSDNGLSIFYEKYGIGIGQFEKDILRQGTPWINS